MAVPHLWWLPLNARPSRKASAIQRERPVGQQQWTTPDALHGLLFPAFERRQQVAGSIFLPKPPQSTASVLYYTVES